MPVKTASSSGLESALLPVVPWDGVVVVGVVAVGPSFW